MLSNKNLSKKFNDWTYRNNSMTVQFHFSDTSMTNDVKVIKNGVWSDQARQDWCYSLNMHDLTDIAQKVCKKKQGQQPRQKWVSRFPWIYLAGYGGKSSPAGHEPTGQKSKSLQKPPTVFLKSVLHRHFCLLHLGIPLIISSRASTWVCISVVLIATQDSDCPSVSYSAPPEMAEFCFLSVSTSASHKMAVFGSFGHTEHHTRW